MEEIQVQQNKEKKIKSPWVKGMFAGFGALALAIILFFVLFYYEKFSDSITNFISIFNPFIIGGAIAYLLAPFCNKTEDLLQKKMPKRKKLPKVLSIIASVLLAAIIIYLFIIMIIPQMYRSIIQLSKTLPDNAEKLADKASEMLKKNPDLYAFASSSYNSAKEYVTQWFENTLLPKMSGIIGTVGVGLLTAVLGVKDTIIGLIASVYFLIERKTFARQAKMLLYSISGQKVGDIIYSETKYADRMFSGFLIGKIIDSAIIGVVTYLFCLIAKMPSALLLAVIIGITNIIPFFGPFIGAIPAGLLVLIQEPSKCLIFVIFIIVLQQIDGNILGPAILGDSTGLGSFWILFSIIVFGGLFGFVGMIIGVPLFAVIYDIVSKLVKIGLKKKNINLDSVSGE